jgi:hypothetical protein
MKKLNIHIEVNNKYWDEFCSVQHAINDLIDLVNSQQEAIEKLEKVITTDTLRIATDDIIDALSEPADDTHRTVTLRIPKGMRVGDAFNLAYLFSDSSWEEFITRSDTDLQKALDEVKE